MILVHLFLNSLLAIGHPRLNHEVEALFLMQYNVLLDTHGLQHISEPGQWFRRFHRFRKRSRRETIVCPEHCEIQIDLSMFYILKTRAGSRQAFSQHLLGFCALMSTVLHPLSVSEDVNLLC